MAAEAAVVEHVVEVALVAVVQEVAATVEEAA